MKAIDLKQILKQGAGCLITAKDTKNFLLIQRSDLVPAPLHWCLPGGSVDEGETPTVAAKREVMEETGFDLTDIPLTLIYKNQEHAPRFEFYTYACFVENEFEPKLNWESVDYTWANIDEMPEPLHWGVVQMINNDKAAKILKKLLEKSQEL